jgi:hypothetical protein
MIKARGVPSTGRSTPHNATVHSLTLEAKFIRVTLRTCGVRYSQQFTLRFGLLTGFITTHRRSTDMSDVSRLIERAIAEAPSS